MIKSGPPPEISRLDPHFVIGTWFWSGCLRPAPGTWGSLAALPFGWLIASAAGPIALIPAAAAIFFLGWFSSNRLLTQTRTKDPSWIVVDEVVGQFLALALVPMTPLQWVLGFALFRAFDITKPWPVSWADRKVGGGLGVMLDDVLAGIYACIVLLIIDRLTGWAG